jgi:hypothetical protein
LPGAIRLWVLKPRRREKFAEAVDLVIDDTTFRRPRPWLWRRRACGYPSR